MGIHTLCCTSIRAKEILVTFGKFIFSSVKCRIQIDIYTAIDCVSIRENWDSDTPNIITPYCIFCFATACAANCLIGFTLFFYNVECFDSCFIFSYQNE